MKTILQIENLKVSYHQETIIENISMELQQGEIVCIVGESGSGKTTVLNSILRSQNKKLKIDSGNIHFLNQNLCNLSEQEMKQIRGNQIAVVNQNPLGAFNPMRKIEVQFYETLKSHGKIQKNQARAKMLNLMERLGLEDSERILNSYPCDLSGGMNQRVSIALAMLLEPQILLADEPTSALDVSTEKQVMEEMKRLREVFRTSILMVTHNLSIAAKIANRLIIMKNGCIVEQGTSKEIFENPKEEYTKQLIAAIPRHTCKPRIEVRGREQLVVRDLKKEYKVGSTVKHAITDITMKLHQGEIVGIVGESGSGKSTLVRQIIQLETPTSGSITLDGKEIARPKRVRKKEIYKQMQMVFQLPTESFDPYKTIRKSIYDTLRNLRNLREKDKLESAVDELMRQVGLEEKHANRYPFELSGGQCQRAAIARAICVNPEILICDEATSALDVTAQSQITQLLLALVKEYKMSMIFVSHDIAIVSQICDYIIVMKNGKIVECGENCNVIHRPKEEYTRQLLNRN